MNRIKSLNRWRPDDEVDGCEGCKTRFSFMKRRHHCRDCGGVFCAECTTQRKLISQIHRTQKQRVCASCFARPSVRKHGGPGHTSPKAGAPPPQARQQESKPPRSANSDGPTRSSGTTATATTTVSHGLTDDPGSPQGARPATEPEIAAQAAPLPESNGYDPMPAQVSDGYDGYNGYHHSHDDYDDDSCDSSDDGFGTPPIPSTNTLLSAREPSPMATTRSDRSINGLDYINSLHDNLRRTAGSEVSLTVMLYPGPGKESALVVSLTDTDTVQTIIDRLAPDFYRLQHGPFKRPSTEEMEALKDQLVITSETSLVPSSTLAAELQKHHKRVVLSTDASIVKRTGSMMGGSSRNVGPISPGSGNQYASGGSVRDFFRSDNSHGYGDEEDNDCPEMD